MMIGHPAANTLKAGWLFPLGFWVCAVAANCNSQAPPTFAQALRQHHVEVTEAALIKALHSPEKEVRGLAAAELAELKVNAALPEIVRAAQNETDAQTQVNLAAAATWLGSDEGLKMLTTICRNEAVSAFVRIDAARHAFHEQDHSCFPTLVELMRSKADPDDRIGALSLASQIKPKTKQEAQTVLASALDALHDQDLGVRLQACEALRWMGDPGAIQPLQEAIDDEQEEAVRQEMRSSLDYLKDMQAKH